MKNFVSDIIVVHLPKPTGFVLLHIFRIGYFGVIFDLVLQTFPVCKHFQRNGNFDVNVLSNCVRRICTITSGIL